MDVCEKVSAKFLHHLFVNSINIVFNCYKDYKKPYIKMFEFLILFMMLQFYIRIWLQPTYFQIVDYITFASIGNPILVLKCF